MQAETSKTVTEAKEQASKTLIEERDEALKRLASERTRLEQAKINLSEFHFSTATKFEEEKKETLSNLAELQQLHLEPLPYSESTLQEKFIEVNSLWSFFIASNCSYPIWA